MVDWKNLEKLINTANSIFREAEKTKEVDYYNAAIEIFKDILDIVPDMPIALLNMATAFYRTNRYKEAIIFYDKSIDSNFENSDKIRSFAAFNYGRVNEDINKKEIAIEYYNKSIAFDKNHYRPYFRIGVIEASQNKNYLSAIDWFREADKLNPKDKIILENIKIAKKHIGSSLDKLN